MWKCSCNGGTFLQIVQFFTTPLRENGCTLELSEEPNFYIQSVIVFIVVQALHITFSSMSRTDKMLTLNWSHSYVSLLVDKSWSSLRDAKKIERQSSQLMTYLKAWSCKFCWCWWSRKCEDVNPWHHNDLIIKRTGPVSIGRRGVEPANACKCANTTPANVKTTVNVQTTANVQTRRQQMCKAEKRHRQQMCKRGDSKCAIFQITLKINGLESTNYIKNV